MQERIGQPAGQPSPTRDAYPTAPIPADAQQAIVRLERALGVKAGAR